MNKKNSVKKTAALLLGIALAVGSVGCNNFIVTDSAKDLAQTVATVNISGALKEDKDGEFYAVADDVKAIVDNLSTDVSKRDLVAYFLSTGYQYVESYGYTYEATFNMLMDGLVSREIMIQYALAYYLKNHADKYNVAGCNAFIESELAKASDKEKPLLEAHPEVLTLKYFLVDGTDTEEFDRAVYNLKKSLNDSLDSIEENYIKTETEEHDHEEARTLPTGVKTEKEDYYDKTGAYNVYTGRNTLDSCGSYEKVDGSTTTTRQKAYNAFLANLQGYNMISTSGKVEDTSKIEYLDYYYVELSSLLGQSLINKYFEALEDTVAESLDEEYVNGEYVARMQKQEKEYKVSPSAFATAMDGVSDTSFLLYGLKDFGFVYNILLPFSASQNVQYTAAKNNKANSQDDLYNIRKGILEGVIGKDLRGSWISSHDHANYSHVKNEGGVDKYYFFDEQQTDDSKYEKLTHYLDLYPYAGQVTENDEGELEAKDTTGMDIDTFISTMISQINKAVGSEVAPAYNPATDVLADYGKGAEDTVYTKADGKVDYKKFMYYKGQANLTATPSDYFVETSDVYKAVSAVNELMFAYSTDAGCLNTYFGYAVSPYSTDFVKEFEYAAQEAIRGGVGTYVVCATDYGWHIIFATYVFENNGNVFGDEFNYNDIEKEGTFSYLFYESVKSSAITNYTTDVQNSVLNQYNNDDSVTLFRSRYKDLLELD